MDAVLGDFQKSQLYKHMKFREVENPYTEEMKKELLEGFRNAEEFAYMKGYEPWENCYQGIKIVTFLKMVVYQ